MDTRTILKYAKISKQSYSNHHPDTFLKFINIRLVENNETSVLVLSNDKEICFSFRGTNEYSDVRLNINLLKTKFTTHANDHVIKYVHYGFLKYYHNVKDKLFEMLDDYIEKSNSSAVKISFTGHSLGSTVVLFALDVFHSRPSLKELLSVVTFGSPRMGNSTFAKQCNEINILRIVQPSDLVPYVPPVFLNYTHSDKIMQIEPYRKYQAFDNVIKSSYNSFNCNIFRMIKNNVLKSHSIDEYIKALKKSAQSCVEATIDK